MTPSSAVQIRPNLAVFSPRGFAKIAHWEKIDKSQPGWDCRYIVSTVSQALKGKTEKASTRLNLRIAPRAKMKIIRAAKLQKYSLTDFIIRASEEAAEAVLADQTRFVLSEKQWTAFNAALDAPAKEIPALRRLLTKPSVFEKS